MKIAFPTDDGEKISAHLGQAVHFKVLTVEGNQIVGTELRAKPHHRQHEHGHHEETSVHPGQAMLEIISDCEVLIAGGMGQPMYERAQAKAIQVVLTGEKEIDRAAGLFLSGELASDLRRVHKH